MEHAMGMDLNQAGEAKKGMGHAASAVIHDIDKQRLHILRCTAQAMASSPGGLRFKAGTRPWLEGISVGSPATARLHGRRDDASSQPAAN
jgi:hypothetical protein